MEIFTDGHTAVSHFLRSASLSAPASSSPLPPLWPTLFRLVMALVGQTLGNPTFSAPLPLAFPEDVVRTLACSPPTSPLQPWRPLEATAMVRVKLTKIPPELFPFGAKP